MKKMKKAIIGLMMLAPMGVQAETAVSGVKDYKVTASFVYNLVNNIEWPEGVKTGEKTVICTISNNKLDEVPGLLVKISQNPRYKTPVEVRENIDYKSADQLKQCNMVYVSSFEKDNIDAVLAAAKAHPIVTVSEFRGFAKKGGMVGFVIEDGADGVLQINTTSMNNSKITINGRLLQLAELFS